MTMPSLDPARHSWMSGPETRAVIEMLENERPLGSRFVGGCVRNALLEAPVADVDISTQIRPERVLEIAEAAGLRAIPTGIEHGTITVVSGGIPYEITMTKVSVLCRTRYLRNNNVVIVAQRLIPVLVII